MEGFRSQEAGINKAALKEKELPIKAQIEVREYEEDHFSYKSYVYQLLSLDESTPHALEKSPNGELVLPRKRDAVVRRPKVFYEPIKGKKFVVNILKEYNTKNWEGKKENKNERERREAKN